MWYQCNMLIFTIHATQLNSHASSLRGVDISMSSSEGTLQELDKLYPSDPNQLAEEAIFNPTKYSLLNLQNLKQSARHVNQGTSSWCALTRNFGRGASKAQPKCQAFFIQREREPIFSHPTEKKHQSTSKQILCLVSILVFSWILFWIPYGVSCRMAKRVIHAGMTDSVNLVIPKVRISWKSAGCGIICWNFGSLEIIGI